MQKIHPEVARDGKRIVNILEPYGYILTIREALDAWNRVSDEHCASWLGLECYTDEEIFSLLFEYGEINP